MQLDHTLNGEHKYLFVLCREVERAWVQIDTGDYLPALYFTRDGVTDDVWLRPQFWRQENGS